MPRIFESIISSCIKLNIRKENLDFRYETHYHFGQEMQIDAEERKIII